MNIKSFKVREITSVEDKIIDFDTGVILIFSQKNSTGKTTFIRSLLYSLGFQIPNTELVKFENYEFFTELEEKDKKFEVYRKGNYLVINGKEYDLPIEQKEALSTLFDIQNNELLENFLGVHYFDQEKGWTLLNRGVIIGKNRFGIESYFRGLKNDESQESYELAEQLKATQKKIAQYRLMLNVAEYQETLKSDFDSKLDYVTYNEEQESTLLALKMELDEINSELSMLENVMKNNKNFSDFIESKSVFVVSPDGGTPFRVTKDSLFNYNDNTEINQTRRKMLIMKRNTIKREIAKIESTIERQYTFESVVSVDDELTKRLANIKGLSAVQIKSTINSYEKQRKKINKNLMLRTKADNPWVNRAYDLLMKYCEELGIPEGYKLDIFTNKLKSKTGSILHKLVFIHKLVYIQLLKEKTGINYPIFCDSPSGREVEKETVELMLNILLRDFSEHQIFIASINKFDNVIKNPRIIQMDGTFFNPNKLV